MSFSCTPRRPIRTGTSGGRARPTSAAPSPSGPWRRPAADRWWRRSRGSSRTRRWWKPRGGRSSGARSSSRPRGDRIPAARAAGPSRISTTTATTRPPARRAAAASPRPTRPTSSGMSTVRSITTTTCGSSAWSGSRPCGWRRRERAGAREAPRVRPGARARGRRGGRLRPARRAVAGGGAPGAASARAGPGDPARAQGGARRRDRPGRLDREAGEPRARDDRIPRGPRCHSGRRPSRLAAPLLRRLPGRRAADRPGGEHEPDRPQGEGRADGGARPRLDRHHLDRDAGAAPRPRLDGALCAALRRDGGLCLGAGLETARRGRPRRGARALRDAARGDGLRGRRHAPALGPSARDGRGGPPAHRLPPRPAGRGPDHPAADAGGDGGARGDRSLRATGRDQGGRRMSALATLQEAAASIPDGALLTFGGFDLNRAPMALVMELIRQRRRALRVVSLPNPLPLDLLVGAGAATEAEFGFLGLQYEGGFVVAPSVRHAIERGRLAWRERDVYEIVQGLRASALGLPFLPAPGAEGSEYRSVNRTPTTPDPEGGEEMLIARALRPDVALVHAQAADGRGNLWISDLYADDLLARASARVVATAERIVDHVEAPTIPGRLVDRVAHVEKGAFPTSCHGH